MPNRVTTDSRSCAFMLLGRVMYGCQVHDLRNRPVTCEGATSDERYCLVKTSGGSFYWVKEAELEKWR